MQSVCIIIKNSAAEMFASFDQIIPADNTLIDLKLILDSGRST